MPVPGLKVTDIESFYQVVGWPPQKLVSWTQLWSLLLVGQKLRSGSHQINVERADATEPMHSFQYCHHVKSTLQNEGKVHYRSAARGYGV